MKNDIVKKDTISHLSDAIQYLIEALTGIATSDKKDWALSVGYLLQRLRGGSFLKQLIEEIEKYRKKGIIKSDYLKTDQSFDCLQELLDFIDNDSPDTLRLNAMKSLYIAICTERFSTRDDVLPLQLMKICRSLSSGELLVLLSTHHIYMHSEWQKEKAERKAFPFGSKGSWTERVIENSGLAYTDLVAINEKTLIEKHLLSDNAHPDGSGFYYTEYYRLTHLGYNVCLFINNYETLKEEISKE